LAEFEPEVARLVELRYLGLQRPRPSSSHPHHSFALLFLRKSDPKPSTYSPTDSGEDPKRQTGSGDLRSAISAGSETRAER
jgi:hypothetical protein